MKTITRTGKFKKDYKALLKRPEFKGKEEKFTEAVTILANGELLPPEMQNHKILGGKGIPKVAGGLFEFHLVNNILVIYSTTQTELTLHRIGTHADFEWGDGGKH